MPAEWPSGRRVAQWGFLKRTTGTDRLTDIGTVPQIACNASTGDERGRQIESRLPIETRDDPNMGPSYTPYGRSPSTGLPPAGSDEEMPPVSRNAAHPVHHSRSTSLVEYA